MSKKNDIIELTRLLPQMDDESIACLLVMARSSARMKNAYEKWAEQEVEKRVADFRRENHV